MSAFSKLTHVVDGEVRIVDESPLIVPIDRLAQGAKRERILQGLRRVLGAYRDSLPVERQHFRPGSSSPTSPARWSAWAASARRRGSRCSWARSALTDCLQVEEAQPSVLEPFAGPTEFANHGERVVVGQRLMQADSDIFLGWLRVDEGKKNQRDYYGRQLKDWKGSAEIEQLDASSLAAYGKMCGWTLARAHARSGDRVAIAAYLGNSDNFDQAILAFSLSYAEQNERDYQALRAAVDSGRIVAETGM